MVRKTKIYFGQYQAQIFILFGIIAMLLWLNHWWSQSEKARISQKALLTSQLTEIRVADKPHPTHIKIQWFVDAPVTDGTLIGNTWTLSDSAAVYLIQSARPGTLGNIIIYGHNTREMLGNIRALKGSERITLTLSDGTKRLYKVTEMHQVTPGSVNYIEPTQMEVLTLFTCAGFADRERFVVRAVPDTIE